jgi:hypothetical protein
MAKAKTTSQKVGKVASKVLTSQNTGSKSKTAAVSALAQVKTPVKSTSQTAATAASKVLTDGRTSKAAKTAAASALAQKTPTSKSKKK